jgi:general L-amino acid transport system permease protein
MGGAGDGCHCDPVGVSVARGGLLRTLVTPSTVWDDAKDLGSSAMAVETVGSAPRVRVAPWNNPVVRGWVAQIVVVGLIGALLCFLVLNTRENLERQQIASGFPYLDHEAGFEIGDSLIAFSSSDTSRRAILVGLLNTLWVSLLGIVLATFLGALIGIGRLSRNWLLGRLCDGYVELFRNVPVLLWIILFYKLLTEAVPGPRQAIRLVWETIFLSNRGLYLPVPVENPIHVWMTLGLVIGIAASWLTAGRARARQAATGKPFPIARVSAAVVLGIPLAIWLAGGAPHQVSWPVLTGFNFTGGVVIQPEFSALLVGLVVYFAAFIADIVRAGVLAVSVGQGEAASALGLTRGQALRLVLLPQAMRAIVPPMSNQYLRIIRSSSLAIAIGYPDLVATLNVAINQTGQAIENVLLIVAAYLTVSLSISAFMNWYNRRVALKER